MPLGALRTRKYSETTTAAEDRSLIKVEAIRKHKFFEACPK